jgi:hypothetical protein
MRVFWEQVGILMPIYRLSGQGLSDADIATKLSVTEAKVQSCIAWLMHFLKLTSRNQLIQQASTTASPAIVLTGAQPSLPSGRL